MIGNKRIIGVCMTKIQDPPRGRAIAYLNNEAKKHGYKLIIFNSPFDFYDGLDEEIGVARTYEFINYDIIDALIIFCSGFLDKTVYQNIAKCAIQKNIPVILEDDELTGCYTVRNDFEESLSELMNHVINVHNVKKTFFIAGFPDNEYSEKRIDIYKRVLSKNGLPFEDSMVDYGCFWNIPTYEVMDRLFARNEELPEAIFCANDAMAVAACEKIKEKGLRVPEDIIVTGFDGSRIAEFSNPRISTCMIAREEFALHCIELLNAIFDDKKISTIRMNPYRVRLSRSCGCTDNATLDYKKMAEEYHHLSTDMVGHEHVIFNEILYKLNASNMNINAFYSLLSQIMDWNTLIAMKPSFLSSAITNSVEVKSYDDELMIISNDIDGDLESDTLTTFDYKDMVPEIEKWVEDDSIYIISAIQVGKIICGYYEQKTNNIIKDSHRVNRSLNLISIVLHMAVADMRQRFIKINKEDSFIDTETGLATLTGAVAWFGDFVKNPKNHTRPVSVTVYELSKYRYIYENFGIDVAQSALCFVTEALKVANFKDCFIARLSDNEIIVINYYDKTTQIKTVVDRAAAVFSGIMDTYNETNDFEFYVDVCVGCIHAQEAKDYKLEDLIRLASAELYHNKIQNGSTQALKSSSVGSKEQYELFNMLITKNLFLYHFQPIVSAKNGEIIAYEALMRTDASIGFNPMEILQIATEFNRLYDIEKATLFNVLKRFKDEKEKFKDRKVFINCIPGYFLEEEDNKKLCKLYSDCIDNVVFEITEQASITDKELNTIRRIGNIDSGSYNSIAVDDYGTGHSNIVNLIKYSPQVVKIDRFLMTDIHLDESKQLVVKSVIDLAKMNNIKVLAEGIETEDELRKVIEMGVDYIQGYYTGRPALEIIDEINADVKRVIIDAAGNN